jgi:two-component system response regulator PilR (NtrC family)
MAVTSKVRVLCVEDNHDECDLVRAILDDFEVVCVENIAEARKRLSRESFALILLDEHLPDGSGLELCKEITKTDGHSPVVIISGDHLITCNEATDAGAHSFLPKSDVDYVEELPRLARRLVRTAYA